MALRFQTISATIPEGTTGRFSRLFPSNSFGSNISVRRAFVALNGFRLQYDDPDHEIKVVEVDVDFNNVLAGEPDKIAFKVECNLADKNDDDPYSGYVTTLIIAETDD
jgi:hypothetical protein